MAFRMRSTRDVPPIIPLPAKAKPPVPSYSQEELDLLDDSYIEKEVKFKRMTEDAANLYLDQYRRTLLKEPVKFEKETIVYDQTIGKWCLVKEEKKN
jgi:hypothetical protein